MTRGVGWHRVRGRGYVSIYINRIRIIVQPKLTQHCKAIIRNQKKNVREAGMLYSVGVY